VVEEMSCPQYIMYSSPSTNWFYPWRTTYDIPTAVRQKLNTKFEFVADRGWLL
jgi:hypothetical protein